MIKNQFPELFDVPVKGDVILDGEVVCVDPNTGLIDFELVMERFSTKKIDKKNILKQQLPVKYVVFDILYHDGRDFRSLPLIERKQILNQVLQENEYYKKVSYLKKEVLIYLQQYKT